MLVNLLSAQFEEFVVGMLVAVIGCMVVVDESLGGVKLNVCCDGTANYRG
jgi:hypothetical protein